MLNAMFNEIKELLGDEYGLVKEFNPHDTRFIEQMNTYDNIGTLYVNNGSLGFIPDGAKMTIYYTLELFIRVKQGINTSDVVVEPLNNLAKGMTGELYTETGGYKYLLDLGLPSSDGLLVNGIDGDKFVRYEIPITAIVTQGVTLEEPSAQLGFSQKNADGTFTDLGQMKGVLSLTTIFTDELENAVFFDTKTVSANEVYAAERTESVSVARTIGYQVSKLYRDEGIAAIDNVLISAEQTGESLRVTDVSLTPPQSTMMKVVNMQRISQRGQPVLLTFQLVKAMRPV